MKAAFFIKPRQIEIRDVAEPVTPDGGIKIKVRACAVCGSDLRRWREGPQPGSQEIIPGHEISGTVIELGKSVSGFKPGERLAIGPDVHCNQCWYCDRGMYNLCDNLVLYGITPGHHGGFAEFMIVPEEILKRGICHAIPEGLSYEAASLAEPCASVIACHQINGTTLGETVVILGAGPIGCLHTAVAKAHGARVIISEPSETRRVMAERFSPDAVVDPGSEDLKRVVKNLTAGIGADKVICANPVAATQQQGVGIVRKGGKVILFGGLPKAAPITTLDGNRIHYDQIEVIGSFSYHPTNHLQALDYLDRGIIQAEKIITGKFSLDEVQKAYELADKGEALKVIVTLQESFK